MPRKKKIQDKKPSNALGRLLKASRATKQPTKKNGVPEVTASADLQELVDQYVEVSAHLNEVKSEAEVIADALRPRLEEMVFEQYLTRGVQSIKAVGSRGAVMVTVPDKWGAIPEEAVPQARKILGKRFDELVEPEVTMKVRPEVVRDEEKLKELTELLGDRLEEFFVVNVSYRPKKGFLQEVHRMGRDTFERVRRLFKHASASLRVI